MPLIRRSATAGAFLDGVNACALSLMFVITYLLARSAIVDVITILITLVSIVLLFRFRINSAWLILGGAIVGWVFSRGM